MYVTTCTLHLLLLKRRAMPLRTANSTAMGNDNKQPSKMAADIYRIICVFVMYHIFYSLTTFCDSLDLLIYILKSYSL